MACGDIAVSPQNKTTSKETPVIIDTQDPAILAHLNPVEVQMLRNITQRLGIVARRRVEQADAERPTSPEALRPCWVAK
jgi:hypothetical protein